MLFRWVSFYSSLLWPNSAKTIQILLSLIWVVFFPGIAQALVTVQPSGVGGSVSGASSGGGTFYYFIQAPGSNTIPDPPAFINFNVIDIAQTGALDYGKSPSLKNQFEVIFTSTIGNNAAVIQQQVVVIQAYPINSGSARPAPIASVNGRICDDTICQAYGQIPASRSVGVKLPYYAAKFFPGTTNTIRIGFYLSDICHDYNIQGGTAQGCTSDVVTTPPANGVTSMQLSFGVYTATDGNALTAPSGAAVDAISNPITISLQTQASQLGCPPSHILNEGDGTSPPYRPGDKTIYFNPKLFSWTSPSGGATLKTLYAVGKENANPIIDSTFGSSNSNLNGMQLTDKEQPLEGFENSPNGNEHPYYISFLAQDSAGIYVPPANVGDCILGPVYAAPIQGSLGKSNCFIATAAFGSGESAPVRMLRQFRDSILLEYDWGKSFVDWYYQWSPPAAEWLINRPILRLIVLGFLVPVEFFAWICLHPFFAVIIGSMGLMAIPILVFIRNQAVVPRSRRVS